MSVLLRLLSYLRPYKRQVLLAWLCLLGSGTFMLAQPKLVAWAVDLGLSGGRAPLLVVAALALLLAAVARGLFAFGQQYLGEWVSQRVAYDLRNRFYDHLQRLSFAYHDRQQTGELMARATQDVESVRWFILLGSLRLLFILLLLFASLLLMAITNWRLALVSWTFLPLIAWRSTVMTRSLHPLWLRVQEGQGRLGAILQESLTGIRVVRAFGREGYEGERFAREARGIYHNSYQASRVMAFNSPLMGGLWMLSLVATVWYGGLEIAQGRLSVGDLTAFVLYLTLLQMPVRSLGWILMVFARARSAGRRIFEVLDAQAAVKERPGARELGEVKGHVRFQGVTFAYDAASPVLKGVDIDAPPGSIIALLGPTGSGKTTIVNLLPRFYDVSGGSITIDGVDIRDVTLASLRRAIGIVQQDVFLFSATIRDNIAYGAPEAGEEEIEAAAKAARIHDFIISLPQGYDTWVGERGITLSGGQKQRIAIARTILRNPRILILDDSTASVDPETEELIQEALGELMQGRTTFVIAHRLRTIKRADQILVLQDGRIVERGSHEELLRREGFYRRIYELELKAQEEAALAQGGV